MTEALETRIERKLTKLLPLLSLVSARPPPDFPAEAIDNLASRTRRYFSLLRTLRRGDRPKGCETHTNDQERACCIICILANEWPSFLSDTEKDLDQVCACFAVVRGEDIKEDDIVLTPVDENT